MSNFKYSIKNVSIKLLYFNHIIEFLKGNCWVCFYFVDFAWDDINLDFEKLADRENEFL